MCQIREELICFNLQTSFREKSRSDQAQLSKGELMGVGEQSIRTNAFLSLNLSPPIKTINGKTAIKFN